ncbi:hypothetical protein [Halobaculum gomorrense]|uniref:Uncharacterized protein n=1 Tax=Halobaculum gomorrense TaxID=43928 RepID=A0A1M5M1S0_9EURY|nr:hypothetical protein [Halobaculum gomorrense]SHG71130.1 hypothetical protein SAMN05443636_0854 [Halobaculum gomorrense]
MSGTHQQRRGLTRPSPYTLSVALVTGVALSGFGIGGLLIGVVLLVGDRQFSTPVLVGILTGIVILLGGSRPSALTSIAGIVVVLSPLVLPSEGGFSRTHRYLLVGVVSIVLPILFIVLTTGTVWPATVVVLVILLAAGIAVYWYTVPI